MACRVTSTYGAEVSAATRTSVGLRAASAASSSAERYWLDSPASIVVSPPRSVPPMTVSGG